MRRVIWSWFSVILAGLLAACNGPLTPASLPNADHPEGSESSGPNGEVVVFAASSLTDAFGEIAAAFAIALPNSNVVFNFAGSQQLAQQLGQGAPADVFASANASQMDVAIEAGRVVSATPQTLVHNRLVIILPAGNPGAIRTLQDLAKPGLKIVLAASEVPVGRYSLQFLGQASASPDFTATYSETVIANVVSYEENVRSILSKIQLGEADAGIVYASDITRDAAEQVGTIEIPDELNVLASYPIAPVADASNPELAQAFIEFVTGEEGQAILELYGFLPARTKQE